MGKFPKEHQIEQKSIAQLTDMLLTHEWITDRLQTDTGEDLLVRIFDNAKWSGLSFYVQLKGTENIDNYLLKDGETISYPVEVEHLLHWENAHPPVVFIVWDVSKRLGYWEIVDNIIKKRDKQGISWRSGEFIKLHISRKNELSNTLSRLRYYLIDMVYPSISSGKTLEFKMTIMIPTDTPTGKKQITDLERFRDFGGNLTLLPEFIEKFQASEWYTRLYGEQSISINYPVFIESRKSEKPMPTRIDVWVADRDHASIFVDFRLIRAGKKSQVFSNQHQNIPIEFKWSIDHENKVSSFNVSLKEKHTNVQNVLDVLNFMQLLSIPDHQIIIAPYEAPEPTVMKTPIIESYREEDDNKEFYEIVEKLCLIQRKLGISLQLEKFALTSTEILEIEEVFNVVTMGRSFFQIDENVELDVSYEIIEVALQATKEGKRLILRGHDVIDIFVLGKEINLGEAVWWLYVTPTLPINELEGILVNRNEPETQKLPFYLEKVEGIFKEWIQQT